MIFQTLLLYAFGKRFISGVWLNRQSEDRTCLSRFSPHVGNKVILQILEKPAGVTGCWFPLLIYFLFHSGVQDYGQVAGEP